MGSGPSIAVVPMVAAGQAPMGKLPSTAKVTTPDPTNRQAYGPLEQARSRARDQGKPLPPGASVSSLPYVMPTVGRDPAVMFEGLRNKPGADAFLRTLNEAFQSVKFEELDSRPEAEGSAFDSNKAFQTGQIETLRNLLISRVEAQYADDSKKRVRKDAVDWLKNKGGREILVEGMAIFVSMLRETGSKDADVFARNYFDVVAQANRFNASIKNNQNLAQWAAEEASKGGLSNIGRLIGMDTYVNPLNLWYWTPTYNNVVLDGAELAEFCAPKLDLIFTSHCEAFKNSLGFFVKAYQDHFSGQHGSVQETLTKALYPLDRDNIVNIVYLSMLGSIESNRKRFEQTASEADLTADRNVAAIRGVGVSSPNFYAAYRVFKGNSLVLMLGYLLVVRAIQAGSNAWARQHFCQETPQQAWSAVGEEYGRIALNDTIDLGGAWLTRGYLGLFGPPGSESASQALFGPYARAFMPPWTRMSRVARNIPAVADLMATRYGTTAPVAWNLITAFPRYGVDSAYGVRDDDLISFMGRDLIANSLWAGLAGRVGMFTASKQAAAFSRAAGKDVPTLAGATGAWSFLVVTEVGEGLGDLFASLLFAHVLKPEGQGLPYAQNDPRSFTVFGKLNSAEVDQVVEAWMMRRIFSLGVASHTVQGNRNARQVRDAQENRLRSVARDQQQAVGGGGAEADVEIILARQVDRAAPNSNRVVVAWPDEQKFAQGRPLQYSDIYRGENVSPSPTAGFWSNYNRIVGRPENNVFHFLRQKYHLASLDRQRQRLIDSNNRAKNDLDQQVQRGTLANDNANQQKRQLDSRLAQQLDIFDRGRARFIETYGDPVSFRQGLATFLLRPNPSEDIVTRFESFLGQMVGFTAANPNFVADRLRATEGEVKRQVIDNAYHRYGRPQGSAGLGPLIERGRARLDTLASTVVGNEPQGGVISRVGEGIRQGAVRVGNSLIWLGSFSKRLTRFTSGVAKAKDSFNEAVGRVMVEGRNLRAPPSGECDDRFIEDALGWSARLKEESVQSPLRSGIEPDSKRVTTEGVGPRVPTPPLDWRRFSVVGSLHEVWDFSAGWAVSALWNGFVKAPKQAYSALRHVANPGYLSNLFDRNLSYLRGVQTDWTKGRPSDIEDGPQLKARIIITEELIARGQRQSELLFGRIAENGGEGDLRAQGFVRLRAECDQTIRILQDDLAVLRHMLQAWTLGPFAAPMRVPGINYSLTNFRRQVANDPQLDDYLRMAFRVGDSEFEVNAMLHTFELRLTSLAESTDESSVAQFLANISALRREDAHAAPQIEARVRERLEARRSQDPGNRVLQQKIEVLDPELIPRPGAESYVFPNYSVDPSLLNKRDFVNSDYVVPGQLHLINLARTTSRESLRQFVDRLAALRATLDPGNTDPTRRSSSYLSSLARIRQVLDEQVSLLELIGWHGSADLARRKIYALDLATAGDRITLLSHYNSWAIRELESRLLNDPADENWLHNLMTFYDHNPAGRDAVLGRLAGSRDPNKANAARALLNLEGDIYSLPVAERSPGDSRPAVDIVIQRIQRARNVQFDGRTVNLLGDDRALNLLNRWMVDAQVFSTNDPGKIADYLIQVNGRGYGDEVVRLVREAVAARAGDQVVAREALESHIRERFSRLLPPENPIQVVAGSGPGLIVPRSVVEGDENYQVFVELLSRREVRAFGSDLNVSLSAIERRLTERPSDHNWLHDLLTYFDSAPPERRNSFLLQISQGQDINKANAARALCNIEEEILLVPEVRGVTEDGSRNIWEEPIFLSQHATSRIDQARRVSFNGETVDLLGNQRSLELIEAWRLEMEDIFGGGARNAAQRLMERGGANFGDETVRLVAAAVAEEQANLGNNQAFGRLSNYVSTDLILRFGVEYRPVIGAGTPYLAHLVPSPTDSLMYRTFLGRVLPASTTSRDVTYGRSIFSVRPATSEEPGQTGSLPVIHQIRITPPTIAGREDELGL